MKQMNTYMRNLGPGLLYAGAAVGVSHLVQSTRAGAEYGFALVGIILFSLILKYPFFRFGPQYAAATGESLLDGYMRLGKWAMGIFVVFTIGTIFIVQATVTVVTAGIASQIFGIQMAPWIWSGIILVVCIIVLASGSYASLDKAMKWIIVILSVSTVAAVIAGLSKGYHPIEPVDFPWNEVGIIFLIPILGWMPAPIDLAVWHSLWTLEKNKQVGERVAMKTVILDFNIGYWGTAFLAVAFISLGALIMYGTGTQLSPNGTVFAGQFFTLYTSNLGEWAFWIVAVAGLSTMFSTTLTCLDAMPRVLKRSTEIVFNREPGNSQRLYWIWLMVLVVGALSLLGFFLTNMLAMVKVATILAFLTAPVLGLMNYLVMNGKNVPEVHRPKLILKILSFLGLIFLLGFSVVYVWLDLI